jgi:prevent-host-death family protein
MRSISLQELQQNAPQILSEVEREGGCLLTINGKPVAQILPVSGLLPSSDPFYRLADLAVSGGLSLSNEQIDAAIYGRT